MAFGGGGPREGLLVFQLRKLRLVKAMCPSRALAYRELGTEEGLRQDYSVTSSASFLSNKPCSGGVYITVLSFKEFLELLILT